MPHGGSRFELHAITPERWGDLERLFGSKGASGGCWCMWYRLPTQEYRRNKGEGNRAFLRQRTLRGESHGLLAYLDGRPVGWCCLAPREEFALGLSRWAPFRRMSEAELAQVGADRVWSIVCFFVDRSYRGRGFGHKLLRAAIRYAAAHGATMLEAYPADAAQRQVTQAGAFSGTVSMFLKTNFEEVGRAYPARAIMRRAIHSSGGRATPKKRFR